MSNKNPAITTGISFGLTSGIITTLGLIVGLGAGTESIVVVIGGVLTIAVADSFSDALGVHMIEESREDSDEISAWKAALATLLAKFLFALSFIVPLVLFPITTAIIVSGVWGVLCISFLSAYLAVRKGDPVFKSVLEHVAIAVVVVIISSLIGSAIHALLSLGTVS